MAKHDIYPTVDYMAKRPKDKLQSSSKC